MSQLLVENDVCVEEVMDEASLPIDLHPTVLTLVPDDVHTPPEVAEVIARLPWWAARGLVYVITAFVLVGCTWASLAKIDMVAVANGTVIPQGNIKPVQPASSGVVQTVFVKEGDRVAVGDALVQLDAAEMRTRLNKLRQELQVSQSQLRLMMVNGPVGDMLEQKNRIARLQTEISAAEKMLRHTTITAPASGIITMITVRGAGEVLQPGQTIAAIAPTDMPLVIEALLPNKDIAFIEKGLPAKLKFEAFPYQDYGIVDGTVIDISPDAVTDKDHVSYYKVTIAPHRISSPTTGRVVVLRPGLVVSAEIVTEQRSVLSLLFEPARKFKSEIVR